MNPHAQNTRPVWRTFAFALLGVLLIQLAWILSLPAFAGIDEHDHSYKAAAVAHGDFSGVHEPSSQGWGEFVQVPRPLIDASRPVCESLPYTTPDNCLGAGEGRDGLVTVASSAARYNPAYYAVVGLVGRPLDGVASLYAMRGASALICAIFLAATVVLTRQWSRTSWPVVTVILAATPIMIYSSTLVAPNGLEMCAAMLFWSALLGAASRLRRREPSGLTIPVAAVAAIPLVTVRALGPLWCLLIVVAVAVMVTRHDLGDLMRKPSSRMAAAVVGATTCGAVAWSLGAGTNAPTGGGDGGLGALSSVLPRQFVLWIFQSVAAFPNRNDMAPLLVYSVVLAAWCIVAALAVRGSCRRGRFALLFVAVLASAVPLATTLATYESQGALWQGRYALPFSMGFILICGSILETSELSTRVSTMALWGAGLVTAIAGVSSTLAVLERELRASPLAGSDAWSPPAPELVVVLVLAGSALLVASATRRATVSRSAPRAAAEPLDART